MEVEIEDHQGEREEYAHHHIGEEGVFHFLSYFVRFLHAVEFPDDRGETVGEPHVGNEDEGDDIVDETCCRQFLRAVMSDHERVGESQNDGSQLSDDDRNPDA